MQCIASAPDGSDAGEEAGHLLPGLLNVRQTPRESVPLGFQRGELPVPLGNLLAKTAEAVLAFDFLVGQPAPTEDKLVGLGLERLRLLPEQTEAQAKLQEIPVMAKGVRAAGSFDKRWLTVGAAVAGVVALVIAGLRRK